MKSLTTMTTRSRTNQDHEGANQVLMLVVEKGKWLNLQRNPLT